MRGLVALLRGLCAERDGATPIATAATASTTIARRVRLAKLRIHFLEVLASDEHLARLAAGRGRHQPFGFHHVDQPRGPAEADAHLALQVRNRRLAGLHDDARGLVVELVLLELDAVRAGLLVSSSVIVSS